MYNQTITSTQFQVAKFRFLPGVRALDDDELASEDNLFGRFDNVSWEPTFFVSKLAICVTAEFNRIGCVFVSERVQMYNQSITSRQS